MAHKRKLQKLQAEAAAAPADEEADWFSSDPIMLLRQNRQMSNRLEEMRVEKRTAEAHVERMQLQQRNYDLHLSTVDRHWLALDGNLRGILARTDLTTSVGECFTATPADAPSLFLRRLLQKELPASGIPESEVDEGLQKRSEFTAEILQQVWPFKAPAHPRGAVSPQLTRHPPCPYHRPLAHTTPRAHLVTQRLHWSSVVRLRLQCTQRRVLREQATWKRS